MRARGKEASHFQRPVNTDEPPVLQLDDQFVKMREPEHVATLLTGAVDATACGFAAYARRKGHDVRLIQLLAKFCFEAGLSGRLRIRTDSEGAIQAVARGLASMREAATFIETTPIGRKEALVL